MKKNDLDRDILTLAGGVVRDFLTKNDFSSFLNHLDSNSVIALKNGKVVAGKDNVAKILEESKSFSCDIAKEESELNKLSDGLYAACFTLEVTSAEFTGSRPVRADFVIKAENDSSRFLFVSFATPSESVPITNVFPVEKKVSRRSRGAAREDTLIKYLLEGLGNREIAKRFSLAEITIKKALSKIYQKYGVKNRGELVEKISK